MIIVISGVDGAGKSTVTKNLYDDLSKHASVEQVSAGKPQSALVESLRARLRNNEGDNKKQVAATSGNDGSRVRRKTRIVKDALPSLILAWMRLRLSRRARRLAQSGVLVISDRWPTLEHGKMDGPKIATDVTGFKGNVLRKLATFESGLYRRIEPADIAFYLVVDEATAIQRNNDRVKEGKETTADIIRRHRENIEFNPIAHRVERIENNDTLEAVLATLKERIGTVR